jgi:radical SAM superfamily enzyme YgiQ (UPF0313 family)
MPDLDIILIHPPAIYDFRQKIIFPGALAPTVEQAQFTRIPIGMLSIADYLDRNGFKVLVDNLGDRMVQSPTFNVVRHLKNLKAKVFGIGLHFQNHSQGAMEIARLCKELHPEALIVMGGLTATRFHPEVQFCRCGDKGRSRETPAGIYESGPKKWGNQFDSEFNL